MLEKKHDGSFKAYIIDFGSVHKLADNENPDNISRDCEALILDSLAQQIPGLRNQHRPFYTYLSFDLLTTGLSLEIEKLSSESICESQNIPVSTKYKR